MKKMVLALGILTSANLWSLTAAEGLQTKLNAMHSMTANFQQVVKAKKRDVSSSSGTMALQRPGRFRWETKEPMAQLIVADGRKMWVYDVDLEQVTVKKQDRGLGGTAALFLSGYGNQVTKDFTVVEKSVGKVSRYELNAKSNKENFQHIQLEFTYNDLTALKLYDQLGQVTNVKLTQVKPNVKLNAKLFQFHPPKGVDIVNQ